MKNKLFEKKDAISLIVLVITIIVLSILAATVIITLSNTNIISEANNAVQRTEAQQIEEAKILLQADGMLGKNPESITIGDTTLAWDDESKTVIEKNANDSTIKIDDVIIPSGFYYVGGSKNTGLVISDAEADENKGVDYTCTGNQFVWVPVDDFSKFVRGSEQETATDSGIYKMTGTLDVGYTEPDPDAAQWEKDEYNAMMLSVQKNHGFYIARFEAGDGNATSERTAETEAHTVVSRKNAYVYNYVSWGDSMTEIGTKGAVYLSQNMYKGSESVVSTLCYGVQWDAIMNYVSDKDHNITNSASWGNYVIDPESSNLIVQKCGSSEVWKVKNIYDLAGNSFEWTMESRSVSAKNRVFRDGDGTDNPVSARLCIEPTVAYYDEPIGFRVALYIK